jgi:hypothetical protein
MVGAVLFCLKALVGLEAEVNTLKMIAPELLGPPVGLEAEVTIAPSRIEW